jgi:hypothetical protein
MTMSTKSNRRFPTAAFATVAVFSVLGPPIGGLIAGITPMSVVMMAKVATVIEHPAGDLLGWSEGFLTNMTALLGFVMFEGYVQGGLAAVASGALLGLFAFASRSFSARMSAIVAVCMVPAASVAMALWAGTKPEGVVAITIYSSAIQIVPAVIAALSCRRLLLRFGVIGPVAPMTVPQ